MGQEADDMRAALRFAEQKYLSARSSEERELVKERMELLQEWLIKHDGPNAGPALGMPGVPWDAYKSRTEIDPLRVAMPVALPGGKWGGGPQSFRVATDGAGAFVAGLGPRELIAEAAAELARAEWAIPTLWGVQVQLGIVGISPPILPPGWELRVKVTGATDNSEMEILVPLNKAAGNYPIGNSTFVTPQWYVQMLAQQTRVRLVEFVATPVVQPFNLDVQLTVQATAALISASAPPEQVRR